MPESEALSGPATENFSDPPAPKKERRTGYHHRTYTFSLLRSVRSVIPSNFAARVRF